MPTRSPSCGVESSPGQGRVADLTPDAMARTMIGAEELTVQPARTGEFGAPRVDIEKLEALDDAGQPAVRNLSLSIRGGEIVGVAGVSGNGQRQLIEVLAGQREPAGGAIHMHGERYFATRDEMRRHKFSLLPEEPLKNACVARMSVADNLAFREFDAAPFARGGWWLNRNAFRLSAERNIERYGSRRGLRQRPSVSSPAATCSAPCWRASSAARSKS